MSLQLSEFEMIQHFRIFREVTLLYVIFLLLFRHIKCYICADLLLFIIETLPALELCPTFPSEQEDDNIQEGCKCINDQFSRSVWENNEYPLNNMSSEV